MDYITFDEFVKVDVRVGTIVSAEVPEGSNKLIKYQVDFGDAPFGASFAGDPHNVTIFSGIRKWFEPEDLVGIQTTFVINLAPKKMGDLGESQGMLFAAESDDGPALVKFDTKLVNGTRLI